MPAPSSTVPMRRVTGGPQRVTNIELFFDLVYVFAVTQLSHLLLAHPTAGGALHAALLLAMVWLAWIYTTWATNWLDPERLPVRGMLLALMLVSLAMSSAIPHAFDSRGLAFGAGYGVSQLGRSLFTAWALRGDPLHANYQRISAWCALSGGLAVAGGLLHGDARVGLWIGALAVDLLGGAVGFATPGLGRSSTTDWTVEGHHLAERCSAFILIALGESVVVIGSTASDLATVPAATVATYVIAFAGAAALWWLYFDRSAEAAEEVVAASDDPGALGRSAYHFVHPVMVAGIIVSAAADERLLAQAHRSPSPSTLWLALGGTGLFLAGQAMFKAVVWRQVPWSRLGALVVVAALALPGRHLPAWATGLEALVVVLAVAVADRAQHRPAQRGAAGGHDRGPSGEGQAT